MLRPVTGLVRGVFDGAGIGVICIDVHGRSTLCTDAAAELLGWLPDELVGRSLHEVIHHSGADGLPRPASTCPILTAARSAVADHDDDDVFWRRDGAVLPVWWIAAPIAEPADVDNRSVAVVVFGSTITRRRAAALQHELLAAGAADLAAARAQNQIVQAENAQLMALGQLSELLNVLDVETGLRRIAGLAAASLADWCVIDRLDGQRVVRSALAHRSDLPAGPDDRLGPLPELSHRGVHSLSRVLRGENSVAVEFAEDLHASVASTPDADPLDLAQAELFEQLSADQAVVVPLVARDQVMGAMTWMRQDQSNPFTDTDILMATVFGRRVGLWLDNLRLYDLQQRAAEALQRSLLTELPEPDHLELVARYVPAGEGVEVGGDWYDAFLTPSGNLALAIGDVTGHDIAAATRMAQVRNMLRFATVDGQGLPSSALRRVDAAMPPLAVPGQATVIAATVSQDSAERAAGVRTLTWSNAGHPPPLLIGPDGSVRVLESEPELLLGVDAGTCRSDHTTELPPGASVVLYTDGLIERPGEPIDQGVRRLVEVAQALTNRKLTELCDELIDRLAPAGRRSDDIALIAVRFHDQARPRPPEAGPGRGR